MVTDEGSPARCPLATCSFEATTIRQVRHHCLYDCQAKAIFQDMGVGHSNIVRAGKHLKPLDRDAAIKVALQVGRRRGPLADDQDMDIDDEDSPETNTREWTYTERVHLMYEFIGTVPAQSMLQQFAELYTVPQDRQGYNVEALRERLHEVAKFASEWRGSGILGEVSVHGND